MRTIALRCAAFNAGVRLALDPRLLLIRRGQPPSYRVVPLFHRKGLRDVPNRVATPPSAVVEAAVEKDAVLGLAQKVRVDDGGKVAAVFVDQRDLHRSCRHRAILNDAEIGYNLPRIVLTLEGEGRSLEVFHGVLCKHAVGSGRFRRDACVVHTGCCIHPIKDPDEAVVVARRTAHTRYCAAFEVAEEAAVRHAHYFGRRQSLRVDAIRKVLAV